ncbi:DeoR/GlpR family DNA-binding transcription regulator [Herbiconiux sp. UC225_62]|uniref:DeoR/GlpR family DNA-binding transcription regulator n=1 Tax=Herbiconiux sp. UC225_62 TaxID=3350168 RepID=UPI0036D2A77D
MTTSAENRAPEFAEERRENILELVNARGRVTVAELSDLLNVTRPTIRKDISTLDQQRKLRRTHGGALAATPSNEMELVNRISSNAEAKRRIAQACLGLIGENDSIFLDSGTTSLAIAEALVAATDTGAGGRPRFGRSLNVLTNSVPVARTLANVGTIPHTLLGGHYRPIADSVVGPLTLQAARQFTVNLAFIGSTGISGDQFSTADLAEAEVKRTMVSQARKVIIPMDSSKIGLTDFVTTFSLDDVNIVVTEAPDAYLIAACAAKDVELVIAP